MDDRIYEPGGSATSNTVHNITADGNSHLRVGNDYNIYQAEDLCLKDLRSTDPSHDKKRIEDTKGGLLEDSYRWILENPAFQQWRDESQYRVLWIKGDPGKGKTMLLCGIINELDKSMAKTDLLSYFFCQATDSRINNAVAVLQGLLYLLINQQPSLVSHVQKKYKHAGKALFEDANAWFALLEIFTNILQDPALNKIYLVIDALDECSTDLPKLLDFIVQMSSMSPHIKWVVSSRNWPEVGEWLEKVGGYRVKLSLELNPDSISTAVSVFTRYKVFQLAEQKRYSVRTRDAVLHHLSTNADDTFLWVALVCQNLARIPRWSTMKNLDTIPSGLNSLYKQMIQKINNSEDASLFKQILASVSIVYQPVTLQELVALVKELGETAEDMESVKEIISLCGSFLTLKEDTVYFVHQSAKEFLTNEAVHDIFPSGREEVNYVLFSRSLQVMHSTLRRDMYDLRAPGYPIERVKQPKPDLDSLRASRYSCIYWVDHLCQWNGVSTATHSTDLQDSGNIDEFLKQKYLYWLEALSLCRSMSKGVVSMTKLEGLALETAHTSTLIELVRDARRFIMYHKRAIEDAPLQTYVSALLFSPTHSLIRNLFKDEEPTWLTVKAPMKEEWGACLQTFEGHSNLIRSVVFSHDSTRLASSDGIVKIWDTSSGECLQTLEGYSNYIEAVAFSHDSTRLVSGAYDGIVKIWDAGSGECLQTLEGHVSKIRAVAFSHDSIRVVSEAIDDIVKIWDASSGECLQALEGYSSYIEAVAFSHDSTRLVSGTYYGTVKICDALSGEHLQLLEGCSRNIAAVALSHDSSQLALGFLDHTIEIRDNSSNVGLQVLNGHSGSVRTVAFSHDSTRLASGSDDCTIKIWDTRSSERLQTLESHGGTIWSIALSPDLTRLVSGSHDRKVRLWDTSSVKCLQTLEGNDSIIASVAFSNDSTQLAVTLVEGVILWDADSSEPSQTFDSARNTVLSHDFTRLALVSDDNAVEIWDTRSNECLHMLKGHSKTVWSLAFSPDMTRMVSGSTDIIKIWNASSGEFLQDLVDLEDHDKLVVLLVFSYDSTRLASALEGAIVKIWNTSSGKCLQTLDGHSVSVTSLAFCYNSTWLASASFDCTVKIWDISSGECLQTIRTAACLSNISFDATSSYLNTEFGTFKINISDELSALTTISGITSPESPKYQGVSVSSDKVWIMYDSENMVWLPSDYRPRCSAIAKKTIYIGSYSGKVWVCSFT